MFQNWGSIRKTDGVQSEAVECHKGPTTPCHVDIQHRVKMSLAIFTFSLLLHVKSSSREKWLPVNKLERSKSFSSQVRLRTDNRRQFNPLKPYGNYIYHVL
jgi:hypothetical protein